MPRVFPNAGKVLAGYNLFNRTLKKKNCCLRLFGCLCFKNDSGELKVTSKNIEKKHTSLSKTLTTNYRPNCYKVYALWRQIF